MKSAQELCHNDLSRHEFPRTWSVLEAGLAEGVAPGMVAGFYKKQKPDQIFLGAWGRRSSDPQDSIMTVDTVFDLASVSKVFATATLAAVLVERGWLSWDTPLRAILPAYPFSDIRISHLLSHTAGLPAWEPFWERMREKFSSAPLYSFPIAERQGAMRDMVFGTRPDLPLGSRAVYSDISFLLLGFALEEITGLPLDRAVRKYVWQPLGLATAFYRRVTEDPVRASLPGVAATEDCRWRGGVLRGQVHDDNCWTMGGYAGHAGAFADARDVLHFAGRLMHGFLSPAILHAIWNRVERPLGCERTLGWDTPSGNEPAVGKYFSPHTVGHLGFTGTSLWIDVTAGLAVVLLTNRVHPTRENPKIKAFRPRFHDALRQDLLAPATL